MTRYRPVEAKVDLPALEERVLAFWKERDVFRRSITNREGAPEWVFYDGPPTANNKPHIGHVEARTFKDMYPRYRTMRGHHVDRKAGWDCHGLPVEVEVEKEIGTKSKRDIETFGVAEFVQRCRESVIRYVDDWKRVSERMGHWIDMDDAYWTMDAPYVQSVWWALKQLYERDLLYRDDRTVAYCPRCGTGLSDAEIALGYTTVVDPSVYVEFPVRDGDPRGVGASIVGWTTTPWTLTSNLGLAVAGAEPYVRVRVPGRAHDLIVAEARLDDLARAAGGTPDVVERLAGSDLVGAHYDPPFPNVDDPNNHRVVAADFVVMNEGTGIVHIAPGFGADDLTLGRREGWPRFRPIDDAGRFTDEAPEFVRGQFVKDADPALIQDLERRGLLVRSEDYEHTYPLCWRCDTPLLYVARPSWYVRTTAFKDRLLEQNAKTNWYPEHIRAGRYGNWLENNVDWSLSRERYWGTPLPIWVCGTGHETPVGSLAELSSLSGRDVSGIDPHRPHIDEVTIACPVCNAVARRVPEVIDAWFDSGAMPYAQWAYGGPGSPGEAMFRERYPADFIAEGLDQTRGWFYSLMAEGVLLFGENSYRNVICHGLVLDNEGRKMSKRLGNAIAPIEAFDRHGADAVRWYMVASGSPWADRRLSFEAIADVVRNFVLTLWNTYAFFVTYANLDEPDLSAAPEAARRPPLDRWMLSRLHGVVAQVTGDMDGYDATGAGRRIQQLVDDLSNWYVRRSRRRFWDTSRTGEQSDAAADKLAAFATLHECLVTLAKLLAPFMPFVTEEIYRNLAAGDAAAQESVHLSDWPVADEALIDPSLEEAMEVVRTAVSLGRTVRSDTKVRVRQPLAGAVLHVPGDRSRLEPLLDLMAGELNVRRVRFAESADELSGWRAKPNFRALGPKLGPRVQEVASALADDDGTLAARLATGETATVDLAGGPVELEPGDVELAKRTQEGWGLASDGPVTVALDLTLDDDLRREGLARELVHHVQALRRSSGLDVSDRVALGVDASGPVAEALDAHREWIASEVLATSIVDGAVEGATASEDVSVEGAKVRITLHVA
jgi:isoleucyl-tRNA synthetase